MQLSTRYRPLLGTLLLFSVSGRANAEDVPSPSTDVEDVKVEEAEGPNLNFDLGVGSAYVWRGANLWGGRTRTQHLSLFPGVTYSNGDFSAFYWGAFQLTGKDKGANVDGGVGAEQDLGLSYGLSLWDQLSLFAFSTAYLWPLATKAVAGTTVPAAVEPGVILNYEAQFASVGINVSYYRGLQEVTDEFSHVYLGPMIGKDVEFNDTAALNLGASVGYKFWTNNVAADIDENNIDVQGNVGVTLTRGNLSMKPALHASWTDIEGNAVAAWGTLNVGYDVGL